MVSVPRPPQPGGKDDQTQGQKGDRGQEDLTAGVGERIRTGQHKSDDSDSSA